MGGLEGRTVLVTGVTGFVGGNMARRLVEEGATVRAAARRPEAIEVEESVPWAPSKVWISSTTRKRSVPRWLCRHTPWSLGRNSK